MPLLYTIDLNRGIKSAALLYRTPGGRAILEQERMIKAAIKECGTSIVNISKHPRPLDWFIDPRVAGNKVSVAEQMINGILDKYRVEYYNEVSFYGLQLSSGGYARYDFILKVPGGIHMIEYDSVIWHSQPENIVKDKLKTEFLQYHGIPLTRYDKSHYYHMEECLKKLLGRYGIRKK